MKERPILFSQPMIRALLADRKSQTRRVVKQAAVMDLVGDVIEHGSGLYSRCPYGVPGDRLWVRESWHIEGRSTVGDSPTSIVRIAYRPCSPFAIEGGWSQESREFNRPTDEVVCPTTPTFRRDGNIRWFPSIHMPRWASRITLEITDVRVQRVKSISEDDALAEGVEPVFITVQDVENLQSSDARPGIKAMARIMGAGNFTAKFMFSQLWNSINAKRDGGIYAWRCDPFAWALTFRRVES